MNARPGLILINMIISNDFLPNTKGAFSGVSMDEYQAAPGESKSSLDRLAVSPLDYRRWRDGLLRRDVTDAMNFGTLLHGAIFEGKFDTFYTKPSTYGPEHKPWNGNATACKEWLEDHRDRPVISIERSAYLRTATDYVRSHPLTRGLLTGGVAELSCFSIDDVSGLLLKGRMDYVIPGDDYYTVVDLKSTADASTAEFAKQIRTRRYHVQAAMYRRILLALGAPAVRFFFIALDTGEIPKVNVRELNPRAMDLGDDILDADLSVLNACRQSNAWPEWRDDNGTGAVACIDLPEWCYPEEELTGMSSARAA